MPNRSADLSVERPLGSLIVGDSENHVGRYAGFLGGVPYGSGGGGTSVEFCPMLFP